MLNFWLCMHNLFIFCCETKINKKRKKERNMQNYAKLSGEQLLRRSGCALTQKKKLIKKICAHANTHTGTYVCVCVCVCVYAKITAKSNTNSTQLNYRLCSSRLVLSRAVYLQLLAHFPERIFNVIARTQIFICSSYHTRCRHPSTATTLGIRVAVNALSCNKRLRRQQCHKTCVAHALVYAFFLLLFAQSLTMLFFCFVLYFLFLAFVMRKNFANIEFKWGFFTCSKSEKMLFSSFVVWAALGGNTQS